MQEYPHTLVATVGGQPQVVTLTLDLLLRVPFAINEVVVVHPALDNPRLARTLDCLRKEFANEQYVFDGTTISCRLRLLMLQHDGMPLADITDSYGAHVVEGTIHRLIQQLKEQKRHIHLSASGGRRVMSLMAISAAQRNFDRFDHIWHIFTPPEVREQVKEGTRMHVPHEAGVKLVEVPFVPAYSFPSQWSGTALDHQRAMMGPQEYERCEQVLDQITPAQRRVLKAFARGLTPQEVAKELTLSPGAVDTHKTSLLRTCRNVWDVGEKVPLGYHFLYDKFQYIWTQV